MLASLICLAHGQTSGDIDPAAKAIADGMLARYSALRTLRCEFIGRSGQQPFRGKIVYRRPDALRITILSPNGPMVEAEMLYQKGKLTVASPHRKDRYLVATMATGSYPAGSEFIWNRNASRPMQQIEELLGLVKEPFIDYPNLASMHVEPGAAQGTGTAIRALTFGIKDRGTSAQTSIEQKRLEIGADGLVRRIEIPDDSGKLFPIDLRNVTADTPVTDADLAVVPPVGALPVTVPPSPRSADSSTKVVLDQIASSYKALTSLSMRTLWINNYQIPQNPKDTSLSGTLTIDLEKPLRDRMKIVRSDFAASYANLDLVSDGVQVCTRQGSETGYTKARAYNPGFVALGAGRTLFEDAGRKAMEAAEGALAGVSPLVTTPSAGLRYVGKTSFAGTPVIEIDRPRFDADSWGIPQPPAADRFFFGQDDNLWRGYTVSTVQEFDGRSYPGKIEERVEWMQADPILNESIFATASLPQGENGTLVGLPPVQGLAPGDTPSALPVKTLDGKEFSIQSVRGKVVVIDAYMVSCIPCRATLLAHAKLAERHRSEGLVLLGLPLDEESRRPGLERFVAQEKLTWPQLYDGKGWASPVAVQFGIERTPFVVVLGRDGRVAYVDPPESELPKLLASELAKH